MTNRWIEHQKKREAVFAERKQDWRIGPTIYQIIVDRFAPSDRLDSKAEHYAAPRVLRTWDEVPNRGSFNGELRVVDGEIEFWGGDLKSVESKIDYIQSLDVDCIYLNPIFEAFTNHKYDAKDYYKIDPQYGTNAELRELSDALHAKEMKLMLDGVFNHMGRRSPMFVEAQEDESSEYRDYFYINEKLKFGYRGWRNGGNLPELHLEKPEVRKMLWEGPDSVVQHYLLEADIDGWRLDVAPDIGPEYLAEITNAAHEAKQGSCVIGECWNFPHAWLYCMDGIMNMHTRELLIAVADGRVSPRQFSRTLDRQIDECDYVGLLRSHMVLENHDTPRLAHMVKNQEMRAVLRGLQFTLPGSPVIYYGSELGMLGGHDPGSRAPMRWDLIDDNNADYTNTLFWTKLRKEQPALRHGDCTVLDTENLIAFIRDTEHAIETVIVAANPTDEEVTEIVPIRYSFLMDAAPIECLLSGDRLVMHSGTATMTIPPKSIRVYQTADRNDNPGYSMYKRVP